MPTVSDILILAAGVGLLIVGAELLVRGAAHLARLVGMRPFVIGVTVVAFGTSAPELAACLGFGLSGDGPAAVTNVLGSNIANVGLILAFTAILCPIPVARGIFRRDLPMMLIVTLLAPMVFLGGSVSRPEGGVLLLGIAVFVWLSYRFGKDDPEAIRHELERELEHGLDLIPEEHPGGVWKNIALVLVGLVGLALGGNLTVDGAVSIARDLGMPTELISLTMVALGTSLPELAACGIAARKREPEIALGNVLGSNVFNLLAVLGGASVVTPLATPGSVWTHAAIATGFTLLAVGLLGPKRTLGRLGGGVLLLCYAGFIGMVYAGGLDGPAG